MFIQIGHDHVGAFTGEGNRHRTTDAAVGAGDQRNLAGQPSGTDVGLLAAIGVGLHVALRARHGLSLFGEGWFWVIGHHKSPRFSGRVWAVDPDGLP
jgi:hypothetical protein